MEFRGWENQENRSLLRWDLKIVRERTCVWVSVQQEHFPHFVKNKSEFLFLLIAIKRVNCFLVPLLSLLSHKKHRVHKRLLIVFPVIGKAASGVQQRKEACWLRALWGLPCFPILFWGLGCWSAQGDRNSLRFSCEPWGYFIWAGLEGSRQRKPLWSGERSPNAG